MSDPIIIAVDGPAASGKGTLSRRVANLYGLQYLDTGRLYRGVAWMMMQTDADLRDPEAAERAARSYDADALDVAELRTPAVGRGASLVAVHPGVRQALFEFQRSYGTAGAGAVLDGRDIGTVIFPEAQVKIFVTASVEERGRRRYEEVKLIDHGATLESTTDELKRRDERDRSREAAPLRPAAEAFVLDTTALTIDESLAAACRHIDGVLKP